jgi:hypothetical protein
LFEDLKKNVKSMKDGLDQSIKENELQTRLVKGDLIRVMHIGARKNFKHCDQGTQTELSLSGHVASVNRYSLEESKYGLKTMY